MVSEDIWFKPGVEWLTSTIKTREIKYSVANHIFYADSLEQAIDMATQMMEGFSDARHDGKGDFIQEYCQGLIDVEEVFIPSHSSLDKELKEYYGLDVGIIYDLEKYIGKNIKLKAKAINKHLHFKA